MERVSHLLRDRAGVYSGGPQLAGQGVHLARRAADFQVVWELPPFCAAHGRSDAHQRGHTGVFDSSTNWTVAGGGGVDYKWRGPFGFRVQADYLRTNLFGLTQNMVRASTGFVIRF